MSKVISFRLNSDNPRDAKALAILQDRLSQGFSTRHTITEAILMLESEKSKQPDKETLDDLTHQIRELLARVEKDSTQKIMNDHITSKQELSDSFVTSIIRVVKPGLKSGL